MAAPPPITCPYCLTSSFTRGNDLPLLLNDIYLVAACVAFFFLLVKWKKNRGGERRSGGSGAAETPPGAFLKVSRVLAYTQHPSLPPCRRRLLHYLADSSSIMTTSGRRGQQVRCSAGRLHQKPQSTLHLQGWYCVSRLAVKGLSDFALLNVVFFFCLFVFLFHSR